MTIHVGKPSASLSAARGVPQGAPLCWRFTASFACMALSSSRGRPPCGSMHHLAMSASQKGQRALSALLRDINRTSKIVGFELTEFEAPKNPKHSFRAVRTVMRMIAPVLATASQARS
jgi:hypothetical protein